MSTEPRLPATEAARLCGVSYQRMRAFLLSGEIHGEQRGRDWYVARDSLDAWITDHLLVAGTLGPTTSGKPRRSNVELLEEVLALPNWDLERLSVELKASAEKIESWFETGVANYYVPRLRKLLSAR